MILNTLTKADMAEHLIKELQMSKQEAKEFVDQFFEQIKQALADNVQVKLSGFGNFDLRDKKQRPGRNPRTGEEVAVEARRVVTFHAGQKLRTCIESNIKTLEAQLK